VLPKDFGLADSLALVEDQARIALSKDHLFQALIEQLQIADPETKAKARQALTRALKRKDDAVFRSFIVKVSGAAAEKAVDILLHKLFPRF
jgi:serine/threonine protein phosphatase PrpC